MTATKKTTNKTTKGKKTTVAKTANKKPRQTMSDLDAAVKVLSETNEALNCQQMIERMESKKYWVSPGGLTPAQTLYSSILRELQNKGAEARFLKTERGHFTVRKGANGAKKPETIEAKPAPEPAKS